MALSPATSQLDADVWDAQTEYDIGVMICRYLSDHPAPPGSEVEDRLLACGETFRDIGDRHLTDLGARRLRSAVLSDPELQEALRGLEEQVRKNKGET